MWIPIAGYETLGRNEKVCGGDVTLIGTRLEPMFIYRYMIDSNSTKEETMLDFNLKVEQMNEIDEFCNDAVWNDFDPEDLEF